MRHATIAGILTLMLIHVPGAVFAEHVIDHSKNASYLFVLSGISGSFEGGTLTLKGVPNVVYFTDRPVRKAGQTQLTKFVGQWDKGADSFSSIPPDAVLSILSETGNQNTVVELQHIGVKGNDISFKIKILQGTVPAAFGPSSLFIDPINNGGPWTGT